MSFIHLHNHDEFSFLDGFGKAEHYVEEAKRLGFKALGLTNHGNVDGCIKFQQACEKENIQPIIGCEMYMVPNHRIKEKGEKRYHICVYAKNQKGWKNILKMLTIANVEGFYKKPRIDDGMLFDHLDGLVISTACASSFINAEDWGWFTLKRLQQKTLHKHLYLELMPHMMDMQSDTNKLAYKLSRRSGIPLIATNDCHYPSRTGAKSQEVLLAIQTKTKWEDPKRWKFDINSLYLKTYKEMVTAFREQKSVPEDIFVKALLRTSEIADTCKNFKIRQLDVMLPAVPGYENAEEDELLYDLSIAGLKKRIISKKANAKPIGEYRKRISEEIGLICELGFERYFLIVWELIAWCKENDIMTGPGRGSVGGCLVAYCLGITDVDPLKYDLIFSRFISPARIDLPDIDMDFEDTKRAEVRKHLEDCYGKNNVTGLSTFLTLKGRASLRDVSRVFNVPPDMVDKASKSIVVRSGGDFRSDFSIEDAFETFEDGIKFQKHYPEVARLSMELEGQVRGVGQHAAGMCVSSEDLRDGTRCNLADRKKAMVANWDKYDAEYVGLMKLDVLGLSALSVLAESRKMIKVNHGIDIVFNDLTLDDKKVYDEISKGYTVGAFQIGSIGLSKFCRDLVVEDFDTLVHATSLWRPGTLRSGMTIEFKDRKHKRVEWDINPFLKELTKDTYGIILYQEQVMRFMNELGGLPWRTCDVVRKVISKSQGDELFMKFKKEFADGCVKKKTLKREEAEKLWNELASFGSYSFNKSHAVEYSMITYWDMYLKVYYPVEFMACSLTYGSADKKEEYIEECRRLNLKLELPKIGVSHTTKWMTRKDDNRLFIPFSEIKGIGAKTAEQINNLKAVKLKTGFYTSRKLDTEKKSPNKSVMAKLTAMGAFDLNHKLTEDELDNISESFNFTVSNDPIRKVRGIYDLLIRKGYISNLFDTDFDKPDKNFKTYMTIMAEIRFGYRQNILKARKGKGQGQGDIAGTGESLGGVYGFIKDPSDTAMLVFNGDLYNKKKEQIEHCGGKWLIIKTNHPHKKPALMCDDVVVEEDILSCNISDFEFDLIDSIGHIKHPTPGLEGCAECNLNEECREPVLPSLGRHNVMIVGEAPGRDEDRDGEGFKGDAGKLLWKILATHHLTRKKFYISNIVKCWPSKTKTPSKDHIRTCTKLWLDEEIKQVKPIHILAFGNTGLKYFKGIDSGITAISGTTEWSPKHNAWINWCIHPASVLYHAENKELFEKSIDNFVNKYDAIGGFCNYTRKEII